MNKLRVLVVDDSPLARDMVIAALSRAPDIEIIGSAADPLLARRQIALLRPDVLTLDVEMPRMDGIAFLEQLMRLHPLPVVMVSSLTSQDSATSLRALMLGAVDVIGKPTAMGGAFERLATELIAKVRLAGQAQARPLTQLAPCPVAPVGEDDFPQADHTVCTLVGGLGALPSLLGIAKQWPQAAPPLLIAFTEASLSAQRMAEHLQAHVSQPVHVACDGLPLKRGEITILTPSQPAVLRPGQAQTPYSLHVPPSPSASSYFADELLSSVAALVGARGVAAILSSANSDGARGLATLEQAGGSVLLQDRLSAMFSTCTQDAQRLCSHAETVPLARLLSRLITCCQNSIASL